MLKINESDIVTFMRQSEYGPLGLKKLMSAMDVSMKASREFKVLLHNLIDSGQVILIKGGKYGLAKKMHLISGYIKANPAGFGFVLPEEENQSDIFIPPDKMREVMDGDRVIAKIERTERNGRHSGCIVRVLERAHKVVIGRYEQTKYIFFVIPNNPFLTQDIIIPSEPPANSTEKTKPAEHELNPKKGELVVVEILEYPTKYRNPTGRIIEILGQPDDPNLDVEIVIREHELPNIFPEPVLEEARAYTEVRQEDINGRLDLRSLLTFTIDGEKARDFDDAISLETLDGGLVRLWVHIADVSHYVLADSLLDEEAFNRGTSVYFPDWAVPMLPPALSNELCSLKPNQDRLTVSVSMDLDQRATLCKYEIFTSVIHSRERLTYTAVRDILMAEGEADIPSKYHHLLPTLRYMNDLARKMRANRLKAGSIDFDLPEPEVVLDLQGDVQAVIRAERNLAHNLIEEFMLAANQRVAEYLSQLEIPSIYRIHEEPEEADVLGFFEFINSLGWAKKKPAKRKKKRLTHRDLQEILDYFRGSPEERVVNFLLLRAMKQARYSSQKRGHFALAMEDYTHFTSPIRRYPDLVVHRLLKRVLQGKTRELKENSEWLEKLTLLANHSSCRERIAEKAERDIIDLKRARYMQQKVGQEYNGIISGVTAFGIFVELEEIFVEGLIHIRYLGDDYYQFNEKKHQLEGERTKGIFRIGDRLRVKVTNVDLAKIHIDFTLITKLDKVLGE